jgi:hypothetical protein
MSKPMSREELTQLLLPQAYADKRTRDVALARFRAFGLKFDYLGTYTERTISTTKLLAINEILGASDDG